MKLTKIYEEYYSSKFNTKCDYYEIDFITTKQSGDEVVARYVLSKSLLVKHPGFTYSNYHEDINDALQKVLPNIKLFHTYKLAARRYISDNNFTVNFDNMITVDYKGNSFNKICVVSLERLK